MTASPGAALRRIVTGINAQGQSSIILDGPPDPVIEFAPGTGLYEIWTDHGGALDREASASEGGPILLSPPPGGVKLRWTTLAPTPAGTSRSDSELFFDKAFAQIGAHGDRPDTSRHPGMHQTQTIDFIIVVAGKVRLILEDGDCLLGPGDVVVQRGTNHAWACESETPAVFVAVLIDKQFQN